jgi:type I restriction enzyme S subunit
MKNQTKFKDTEIGRIPEDWDVKELQLVCVKDGIQTGPFGSQLHNKDYVAQGTPIITVEHLGENRIIHNDMPRVSDKDKNRLIKYVIKEGDIIFSRVGSVDRRAIAKKSEEGWLFSGRCLRVRTEKKKIDSSFLSYYFGLETFKEKIRSYAVGATMPSLNTKLLSEINVIIPSIIEQRLIAEILSSLDSKIELNQQMNKTLEAIGQVIFKRWFIDFEFPNENGKPYKSSGGEMVDSELGEIPKGWRVGMFTEMFDFMEGPGIRNWQYTESGRRFINIRLIQEGDIDINGSNFISVEEAETKYKHFHLQERDMVVSTSGTLGRSAIVRKEHLPLLLNTSVIRFRPNDGSSYGFMYQFLNAAFFQNELKRLASGSVQLNFGPVHLKQIIMVIPVHAILTRFTNITKLIYDQIVSNYSQIQTLSLIRDSLLPKLMSGKIRVI